MLWKTSFGRFSFFNRMVSLPYLGNHFAIQPAQRVVGGLPKVGYKRVA